jgi:hypothetical protein
MRALEGGHHVRVEVAAPAARDHRHRGVMGQGFLVAAPADQGIVDRGQRHQPAGQGDGLPGQPAGISAAVPALQMRQRHLLGHGEQFAGFAQLGLGPRQQLVAARRVGFDDGELLGREPPRLAQEVARHLELAQVVQGRGAHQQLEPMVVELGPSPRHTPPGQPQHAHIALHAQQVPGRFVVAPLGQQRQGPQQGVTLMGCLAGAMLQLGIEAAAALAQQGRQLPHLQQRQQPGQHPAFAPRWEDHVGHALRQPGLHLGLQCLAGQHHQRQATPQRRLAGRHQAALPRRPAGIHQHQVRRPGAWPFHLGVRLQPVAHRGPHATGISHDSHPGPMVFGLVHVVLLHTSCARRPPACKHLRVTGTTQARGLRPVGQREPPADLGPHAAGAG